MSTGGPWDADPFYYAKLHEELEGYRRKDGSQWQPNFGNIFKGNPYAAVELDYVIKEALSELPEGAKIKVRSIETKAEIGRIEVALDVILPGPQAFINICVDNMRKSIEKDHDNEMVRCIDDMQLIDISLVKETVTPGATFVTDGVCDSDTTNPLTLVKIGGEGYKPTPADLDAYRKVFEEAQYDRDYNVIPGSALAKERDDYLALKGRSVGKSTELGANAINEARAAVFAVEKEIGIRSNVDKYLASIPPKEDRPSMEAQVSEYRQKVGIYGVDWGVGKSESRAIIVEPLSQGALPIYDREIDISAVTNTAISPDGVTCRKCYDFNAYCDTPSELDGTHVCYKCKKGY